MADSITVLEETLGIAEEQAEALLFVTHGIDRELTIRAYGYAKDNLIPSPMSERLADPAYVRMLLDAARDEGELPEEVLNALQAHFDGLSSDAE